MSLIALFIWIILIGVLVYLVNMLPIPAQFKQIVLIVGVIVAILLVLQAFGLWAALTGVQVPQVR